MGKQEKCTFICTECGYVSAKWLGRCPSCNEWNSFEEEVLSVNSVQKHRVATPSVLISELSLPEYIRMQTGLTELDRVLGGGLVAGSVVLLSGEPGIGKSTLLLKPYC